ncbi:MAG: hypothetical protein ACN4GT_10080 [Gammaproteobacteria bacterium]
MLSSLNSDTANKPAAFVTTWPIALLVGLAALFLAFPVPAAKGGGGKGGGGNGGGGGGGGPQPELHLKWRVQLAGPYSNVRPVVGPDGTIYAVDVFDHLFAVAPDGTLLWSVAEAGSKGLDVGPDGTIYTGNENWIKAYNADGSLKWTFTQTPRAFVLIDVAVGPDGHVYAVASSGMGVFSLADMPAGPVVRWTNPEVYSRTFVGYTELAFGPTSDGRDQQLYFYANAHTRAVRLSDGASVFTIGGNNQRPQVSPLDGTWHIGDSAYTPDASLVWMFEYPPFTGARESAMGQSGMHYAVNQGRTVYAIDPFGIGRWNRTLEENVGLPDVDPTESMLLMPTSGTHTHPPALKAINTSNGASLWRMEFPPDDAGRDVFVDTGAAFSANGDTAYVMTAVAGGGYGSTSTFLNAVDTDASLPSASTVLRSADIYLDARSKGRSVGFAGTVTVLDENRGPISGATVSATWTLPDGSTLDQSTTTSGNGEAKFNLSGDGGLYWLTVTDIGKEGYAFDAEHSLLEAGRAWY